MIISRLMTGNVSRKNGVLQGILFFFTFALTLSSNICHLLFINLRRRDCV